MSVRNHERSFHGRMDVAVVRIRSRDHGGRFQIEGLVFFHEAAFKGAVVCRDGMGDAVGVPKGDFRSFFDDELRRGERKVFEQDGGGGVCLEDFFGRG